MSYCFKNNYFGRNMHKNALFSLKKVKSHSAGILPSDPFASGGWGLCCQTHNRLWRLGAEPPESAITLSLPGYDTDYTLHVAL